MEAEILKRFCQIAYNAAGISVGEGRDVLVSARVAKRQRALAISGDRAYLEYLERDKSGAELTAFLDAMTTNFTFFFRENDHFIYLSSFLKERYAAGQRRFRLWSAASSSGEEPYSIAITALRALPAADVDLKILATDISTRMLDTARAGIYGGTRLRGLTGEQLRQYFVPVAAGEEARVVRPEVRDLILFKRLNLAHPRFPMKGPFDAIFCRNVMMYFDIETRQRLVKKLEALLHPEGVLFAGLAESLNGLHSGLIPVQPSTYRRPEPPLEPRGTYCVGP